MVIGEDFAWAHLAKTGGNSTLKMFMILDRLVQYHDPIDSHKKHLSFEIKEEELGISLKNKKRILNIRRLPSWILSHVNFQKKVYGVPINERLIEGIVNIADPDTVNTNHVTYQEMHVDESLIYYDYQKVNHWLRTENLASDFISIMSTFSKISKNEKAEIHGVRDNVNPHYNKSIKDNFSNKEISQLYEHCPIWAGVEMEVYGNVLNI